MVDTLQVLGPSLCGKGLDGGQRSEGGLARLTLERLLVRRDETDLPLLLREEIVRNHGHREAGAAGLAIRVGWRRVLNASSGGGKGLALVWEDVRVWARICRGGGVDGVGLVVVDGGAEARTLR